MISLRNFALRRGERLLLSDVDMALHAGWRVGVVGRNGTGKTSLFGLITGEITPDTGNAFLVIDARIENQGRERGAYSFLFFGVTDAAGKIYRPPRASPNMAPGPALASGELGLRAVVRGSVVIEMPLSLASGVIKYTDERANSEFWYVHQFAWK